MPVHNIRLAQEGDPAALTAVYETYAPLVSRFVSSRLRGPDELIEDLTAEVFVRVFQKLGRYRDCGVPFAAWVRRIAHNLLVDYVRHQRLLAWSSLDAAGELAEPATGRAFGRVLDRQMLEPALARLPADQRRVLQLRFLDDLSVADTAALMMRSENAAKQLQTRALVSLRRSLEPASPYPCLACRPPSSAVARGAGRGRARRTTPAPSRSPRRSPPLAAAGSDDPRKHRPPTMTTMAPSRQTMNAPPRMVRDGADRAKTLVTHPGAIGALPGSWRRP